MGLYIMQCLDKIYTPRNVTQLKLRYMSFDKLVEISAKNLQRRSPTMWKSDNDLMWFPFY